MIVQATMFNRANTEVLMVFRKFINISFQDQLNNYGSFTIQVPEYLNLPNDIIGNIIKFTYGENSDDYVFAGVVDSYDYGLLVDNENNKIVTIKGKGALALFDFAIIENTTTYEVKRDFIALTPGEVITDLVNEAKARGALLGVGTTPGLVNDYYGIPFNTITYSENVGTTLDKTIFKHCDLGVDFWLDGNINLNYAGFRGINKTESIKLRYGKDLSAQTFTKSAPVVNSVFIGNKHLSGNEYNEYTDAPSIAIYGRKETYINFTNTTDTASGAYAADRTLSLYNVPLFSFVADLSQKSAYLPYIDYSIGDIIDCEQLDGLFQPIRVYSITVNVDAENMVTVVPEFGNLKQDLNLRLDRALRRQEEANAFGTSTLGTQFN